MDDLNFVLLEGCILFVQEVKDVNEKKVLNFVVENIRETKIGSQRFKYNCVAWDKIIEKFGNKIKEGEFVRITGHLQDSVLKTESSDFHYAKICVDHIESTSKG